MEYKIVFKRDGNNTINDLTYEKMLHNEKQRTFEKILNNKNRKKMKKLF